MVNGLFIQDFRGAGTPGAPGVGSTRRGLEQARQAEQLTQTQQIGLQATSDEARIQSLIRGAVLLKQIQDPQRKIEFLRGRIQQLDENQIPSNDTREALALAEAGDFAGLEELTDQGIAIGEQLRGQRGRQAASAKASAPQTIRKVVGKDEKGEDVFGLFNRQIVFDPETQTSKAIETRIEGELVTSTGETISQQRVGKIEQKKLEAEAKATGKALGESKSAPLIAKTKAAIETAVKLAQADATSRGETLTDLARSQAALPGLRDVVGKLKELAPIVTSTIAGKLFDVAVKEFGFGSTTGANARAKFISIIDNQVLPLLKATFGAAFTVKEGESLKATLGDPDASPTQKIEQINSFIEGKVREIQGKQRELGGEVTSTEELTTGQPLFSNALNKNITEQDIKETLSANPGLTREQLLQQLGVQ